MNARWPSEGIIYTETIVHTAPERYVSDAPYQLAILEADSGERFTVRFEIDEVSVPARIGDRARFLEERDGVPFYSRVHI